MRGDLPPPTPPIPVDFENLSDLPALIRPVEQSRNVLSNARLSWTIRALSAFPKDLPLALCHLSLFPKKKERSKIFDLSLNFPEIKMVGEKGDSNPRSMVTNHMAYHLETIIIISSPLNKKGHP